MRGAEGSRWEGQTHLRGRMKPLRRMWYCTCANTGGSRASCTAVSSARNTTQASCVSSATEAPLDQTGFGPRNTGVPTVERSAAGKPFAAHRCKQACLLEDVSWGLEMQAHRAGGRCRDGAAGARAERRAAPGCRAASASPRTAARSLASSRCGTCRTESALSPSRPCA